MRVETVPELSDAERRAVSLALVRAGVVADATRTGDSSDAWSRAAMREGVDAGPPVAGYALSPRSTRGATRA